MSQPLQRREFIRSVSLAGASLALTDVLPPFNNENEIINDFLTVSFDQIKGTIHIKRSNGAPLITGATVCANTKNEKLSIAAGNYKHKTRSTTFTDPLGQGKQLIILSKDRSKEIEFETRVSLYQHTEVVTIETICKNVSGKNIVIKSLEPLRVISNEGGHLHVPKVSKCITNGEMYFDAGAIHQFRTVDKAEPLVNVKGVKLANQVLQENTETIHSWWNAGFFSGYDQEGVVIGYLKNNLCLGNLLIARTAPDTISCIAESVYAPELVIQPGKTISSNRLMVNIAANTYVALENYADAVGKVNNARTQSILNGWCSWFYTLAQVSEKEVLANTAFAATHLKPYGLEYIQIDEGYQRWHGEWEGNERFPNGMKWLAGKIKSYGFKPGIWISPYVISEPAAVFQQHPEWLVKRRDGSLQRIGNWPEDMEPPANEDPKRYCLDITHPEAAQWLHDLIQTIVHDWGYEMIKIDFVAWSVLAAERFYDPGFSAAQVYRKGMEIMRKAAGNKCHILECGPGATTVGLIDSMRIELDVYYGYADAAWDTYFLNAASSASAAAKRYYFHKRTWVNDVDHVCIDLLNHQQAEAAASIIALSGGNMFSGDRLVQLDPYKLEILKKITPSSGEAATPIDLFDHEMQSVFAVKIKKPYGEWTVAGFFNESLTETVEKEFPLDRLWLDPGKTYVAFDFWRKQFAGEVTGTIRVRIPPGSVTLLSLHEKTGKPQFISTDRHVMQGAVETKDVQWNDNIKTLTGKSNGPLNSSYNVYVYLPDAQPWNWGSNNVLFRDYENYSLKLTDNNIMRVHLRFDKSEQVYWEIKYDPKKT